MIFENRTVSICFLSLVLVIMPVVSFAQLKFDAIFSDHMVLQRGMKVPVWGTSNPGDRVTINFGGIAVVATADKDGSWKEYLPPMQANSRGRELVIEADVNQKQIIKDVLVGDVWLCSGQSNMQMAMQYRQKGMPGVVNWQNEIKKASYPLIRLYNHFRQKGASVWQICDTGSVRLFSAVAYYFGVEIFRDQNVPIGLINQSIGGTSIQKWIPEKAFAELPWAAQYIGSTKVSQWGKYSVCYNKLIAPFVGFGIKGVIWYQGESNSSTSHQAYSYRYLLPLLINSWRKAWGQGDIPFVFVQLPIWQHSKSHRYIREGQLLTLKSVDATGMITTGDKSDYSKMLHPPDKKHIGERLAVWALVNVYKRKAAAATGPIYKAFKITGNKIEIQFSECGSGLRSDGRTLTNFAIAGRDSTFLPAKAEITGKNVVSVYSDAVKNPVAVRFCWGENIPVCNLFNSRQLPASPFRTDTWGDKALEDIILNGME